MYHVANPFVSKDFCKSLTSNLSQAQFEVCMMQKYQSFLEFIKLVKFVNGESLYCLGIVMCMYIILLHLICVSISMCVCV